MNSIIKQYQSIKAKYPDAILLFRIGDYYEILGQDAKIGNEILGLEPRESRETELKIYYLMSL